MPTNDDVKKILKNLDPTSVAVDSSGKIIIKDNDARAALNKLKPQGVKPDAAHNYINCDC